MKTVYLYSHTHWDREWYLAQRQFQYLLGNTLDEILDLLEGEPRFRTFVADGQTSVLEDYFEIRPTARARVQPLLDAGRLVIGPWYTMPDLWIPGGESLIRNLLQGRMDCEGFGLAQPNVGYVPDSFGHIEQMPQLLNGFGIDNYLVSRGEPMEGRGQFLEFNWVAPDRRHRVRAHYLPSGYHSGGMLQPATDAEGLRAWLEALIKPYAESACPETALICNGIDHIWVQRDLPEILDTAQRLFPDYTFVHGALSDYLQAFTTSEELPERIGHLRGAALAAWSLHGTWSSRIDNKIANGMAEAALANLAEPLSVLASLFGGKAHRDEQRLAWRWLLQCHAHDSICGCSIDRVHTDVNQRFTHVQEMAEMIAGDALNTLNGPAQRAKQPTLVRYAGLGGATGCVDFLLDQADDTPVHLQDAAGNRYPVQVLAARTLNRKDFAMERPAMKNPEIRFTEARAVALLPAAAPCAVEHYAVVAGAHTACADPVTTTANTLENAALRVSVQPNGTLDVLHKGTGRTYRGLLRLTDDADLGGGYAFEPLAGDTPLTSDACRAEITVQADGPLRGTLHIAFDWQLPAGLNRDRTARLAEHVCCRVETTVTLETGSETLQCRTRFSNAAKDHRVRLALPSPLAQTHLAVERAFVVATDEMTAYQPAAGQDTHPMRNWADLADADGGFAFAGQGLHEFSLTPAAEGSVLEVTLLRAVPFVFLCGTWETPAAQLPGVQEYRYALLFHAGDWRQGQIPARAQQWLYPAIAEVHGSLIVPWVEHPHASTWFGEIDGEVERPTSSFRSSWRTHFAHRDGWRRREEGRLPQAEVPERLQPVQVDGDHVLISALKLAERDPQGNADTTGDIILRLYSLAAAPQACTLTLGLPITQAWLSNLAEDRLEPLPLQQQTCQVKIHPFEIVTVRLGR